MAEVLSGNNVEEEFVWSVTLDEKNNVLEWNPSESESSEDKEKDAEKEKTEESDEEDDDEELKPGHKLLIRNAFLDVKSASGEVNVVQMECLGYKKAEVKCPIVALEGGKDYQKGVDQEVPCKAKFTLISGKGPVTLVGTHTVDFYGYRDLGGRSMLMDQSEAEEEDEEEDMEETEDEPVKNGKSPVDTAKAIKRAKAEQTPDKNGSAKKKAKV